RAVVFAAHLLGDKKAVPLQHPADLLQVIAFVTVEDQVEAVVCKRHGATLLTVVLPDGNAQRRQASAAKLQIGRPALGDTGEVKGMVKPQKEFPSASAHIQQAHPWTEEF